MRFGRYILGLLLLCSFLEARIFTSADGIRKMEASITAHDPKSKVVSILRKDGKSFHSSLTSYSEADQKYILKWSAGRRENYLYVGKEYPGHLAMFQKILDAGGVGYGPVYLNGSNLTQVITGQGPTPFLAWVNGYDQLNRTRGRFATQINFELIQNKWRARIRFQASQSVSRNSGFEVVRSGNAYGLTRVGGPVLYQQPRQMVVVGENVDPNSILVLPRSPSLVYVNPFKGGVRMNGAGISQGGFTGTTRSFSNQAGITIQVNR